MSIPRSSTAWAHTSLYPQKLEQVLEGSDRPRVKVSLPALSIQVKRREPLLPSAIGLLLAIVDKNAVLRLDLKRTGRGFKCLG